MRLARFSGAAPKPRLESNPMATRAVVAKDGSRMILGIRKDEFEKVVYNGCSMRIYSTKGSQRYATESGERIRV